MWPEHLEGDSIHWDGEEACRRRRADWKFDFGSLADGMTLSSGNKKLTIIYSRVELRAEVYEGDKNSAIIHTDES